jgi:hypothetical protein
MPWHLVAQKGAMAEEKNHRASSGIGRTQFSLATQSDS